MTAQEITDQLQKMAAGSDFAEQSEDVVDTWISKGVGVEAVDAILRFMEDNPHISYGAPGALLHFVERFYRQGYEQMLIDSIRRKATPHTVWMLNRLINGSEAVEERRSYVSELEQARLHTPTDEATLDRINHFLDRLASESPHRGEGAL